jgi:glyoxylase-like metal-dependent hydrolase (beta-lactamase superfamily II)
MRIQEFYDKDTFTLTYVAYDPVSKDAIIIDPVLNYDPKGSMVSTQSLDRLLEFVQGNELKVHLIMETHAHADHLTSAQYLKNRFPEARTVIHENIKLVQQTFKEVFNFKDGFDTEGQVFDQLVKDDETLHAGTLQIHVIHTPGHTPACVSYRVNGEALFTGDALFMPDFGTGRCDFPKGSAEDLYTSIHDKLYKLPDSTRVYVGHDYQPGGRALAFETTIGESKSKNIQLKEGTSRQEFVEFRNARDSGLAAPVLLLPSIQVNAQNGQFPKKEDNKVSYLKIPVNGLE